MSTLLAMARDISGNITVNWPMDPKVSPDVSFGVGWSTNINGSNININVTYTLPPP
jgi:hypothetical protein